MNEKKTLLELVIGVEPISYKKTQNKLELFSEKFSKWSLVISVSLIFLFVLLALLMSFFEVKKLSDFANLVVLICLIVSMVLPLLSLVIFNISVLYSVLFFFSKSKNGFLAEVYHDNEIIHDIMKFSITEMREVRRQVQVKIERIKRKIGIFAGNTEKVAIFPIMGLAWFVWKEFVVVVTGSKRYEVNFENVFLFFNSPFIWPLALLTGFVIGMLLLNNLVVRYCYWLDLLDSAIDKKLEKLKSQGL